MTRLGLLAGSGAAVLLALAWFAMPGWLGFLMTVALAKGLVVLGVVLLMRGGLVSFGQGLFFAGGAYAAGFLINLWGVREALILILAGTLTGAALSLVTGLLIARYREIFFAMLTLAFSMTLWGVLLKAYEITGGSDGLRIGPPTFLGMEPRGASLRLANYYLTLACAASVAFLVYRFMESPLGHRMRAIRDNEIRVGYLGGSVKKAVLTTFVLAGALGGLGGVLQAMSVGQIDPTLAYWTTSGEFVFVALIGGGGSVIAPLVGAVAFEVIRAYALKYMPDMWQMTLGMVMLLIVLFLPSGLWGVYERAVGRARA
ncbi:MAG: branched-chain amino acid ABC transporter permease [Actinomycetota bacterium]